MLFDTLGFAFFLSVVFLLYWFVANKSLSNQNTLLLVSSYFFYSCWDWKFLSLLLLSTLIDYLIGLKIHKKENNSGRKFWLVLSIVINLSLLCTFKYYNFFISSFNELMTALKIQANLSTLNLILPIGISFYTFHGLSYVIDIYNRKTEPDSNFINYAVFVSFFPLLVAGPIERATHLLPQIQKERKFDYGKAVDGLRQILWGLFKKIVISNQCSIYSNIIFNNPSIFSGSTLLMGAVIFAFQIYADFSGYTDIALGTARLFGIELLQNFSSPYFSRNLTQFWRRWHISLSSWFRDYLYIPLGGSKKGKWITIRNTMIIFLIGGFWHGANWTFVIWGFINAIYLIPSILFQKETFEKDKITKLKVIPSLSEFFQMSRTFMLIALVCIFFRSQDISHAISYFSGMLSKSTFTLPAIRPVLLFFVIGLFLIIEWKGRDQTHALKNFALKSHKVLRLIFYYSLIIAIFLSRTPEQKFIYFQF